MKTRIFHLLLSLFISLAVLTACSNGGDDTTATETTLSATEETFPAETGNVVFAPGVCNYRIVYPADDTDAEFTSARRLQTLIEEKCGVKPELVRSSAVGGDKSDPNVKEILLSYVDFEEFDVAISECAGYNTYIVRALGNKIVVTGHEREGFEKAFEAFVAHITNNTVEGKLVISEDFLLTGKAGIRNIKDFYEVPGYPGGMIEDFSDLGDGYDQVTIYKTDENMYEDYAAILSDNGYTLYSENEIDGNRYSTYTKGEEMLYYYYCPNSGETRVIIAEDAELPVLEAPTYKKVCEPAYITLAIYDENGKITGDALGGIIRFEDGSFLVYDGGNKNTYQARHIYSTLLEYAPNPNNIVIRAWVFSHFHGDHVGAFQKYAATYKNSKVVTIESYIYNFCNTAEQTKTFSTGQMTATETAIETMGGDIPVYKCLTGQIFRFPGMDMEILATMSDFIPQVIGYEASDADLSKGDGNTMTVVVRLTTTAEGNTCMLTGDATNIVLDNMVDRYSTVYLDSDIVTTPHHAHNRDSYRARNATIKFYDAVKPDILVVTSTNMNKFTPTAKYSYSVNVHVLNTYDPEIYLMNEVRLISMATLKEIK